MPVLVALPGTNHRGATFALRYGAEENIRHAEVCLKRANEAEEVYVRVALKSGETSNDRFAHRRAGPLTDYAEWS